MGPYSFVIRGSILSPVHTISRRVWFAVGSRVDELDELNSEGPCFSFTSGDELVAVQDLSNHLTVNAAYGSISKDILLWEATWAFTFGLAVVTEEWWVAYNSIKLALEFTCR